MEEKNICLDQNTNLYIFECPNCQNFIQVERGTVACSIFRHLYYANVSDQKIELISQVDPHASQQLCEQLLRDKKAVGCGKPFQMIIKSYDNMNNPIYIVKKCDYL